MSDNSRHRILSRLKFARAQKVPHPQDMAWRPAKDLSQRQKTELLKSLMDAVRAEVHIVSSENWVECLKVLLKKRQFKTLLYAANSDVGKALKKSWEEDGLGLPALTPYGGAIEIFKEKLFQVDAAITSAAGGIAETGAIILCPDADEPRLMSLVPPVHIAVLKAEKIYGTLGEAMREGRWAEKMPTNLLLISGPSKTADIELTLAFGVHGPKELILFILEK